jgi:hypothetical protein
MKGITIFCALLLVTVFFLGCGEQVQPTEMSRNMSADGAEMSLGKYGELREAQSATAKYHALKRALDDGYVPVTPCDELPGVGAQGIHYLNFALLDDVLDHTTPELLLYIPTKNELKFVGVEYAVLNVGQPAPSLFGQAFHPFNGLFVLHVWLLPEVPNPSGLFADWNPNLSCNND